MDVGRGTVGRSQSGREPALHLLYRCDRGGDLAVALAPLGDREVAVALVDRKTLQPPVQLLGLEA